MPPRQPTGDPGVEGAEATPGAWLEKRRNEMTTTESSNGRIRINVSTSVKGVVTCEYTVEVGDASQEQMDERVQIGWTTVDSMELEKAKRFPIAA